MSRRLIALGRNGYLPLNGQHSSCFLLLFEDAAFLLDAGTGAARLHEAEIRPLLEPYAELHILLSHYHVDHTCGLYYAFTAWRHRPLVLHAPAPPLMEADPREAIGRYFSPPLNSYRLEDSTLRIEPLTGSCEIAGHRMEVWPQPHPGGSIGMRIDDALAYVTDTLVVPEHADRVRGVDLLLHELWLNDEDAAQQPEERARHAYLSPVTEFVRAAQPRRFMPIHLYPHYPESALQAMAEGVQAQTGVPTEVPQEKIVYTF